jgi:hypothetical protein
MAGIVPPEERKTVFVVGLGMVGIGTSCNIIARHSFSDLDIRSVYREVAQPGCVYEISLGHLWRGSAPFVTSSHYTRLQGPHMLSQWRTTESP